MRKVSEILSNPHCEVIRPLCVDYNLIEVNYGQCWSIMDRRFVVNAIADKDIGDCVDDETCLLYTSPSPRDA